MTHCAMQCATTQSASQRTLIAAIIAAAIAIVIVLLLCVTAPSVSRFYTESATEPPTRLDIPYTGTEPLGFWGEEPWGETAYAQI